MGKGIKEFFQKPMKCNCEHSSHGNSRIQRKKRECKSDYQGDEKGGMSEPVASSSPARLLEQHPQCVLKHRIPFTPQLLPREPLSPCITVTPWGQGPTAPGLKEGVLPPPPSPETFPSVEQSPCN